jgi:hypothetical protein
VKFLKKLNIINLEIRTTYFGLSVEWIHANPVHQSLGEVRGEEEKGKEPRGEVRHAQNSRA